jgi:LSD1 subclass zinc finger protein
MVAGIRPRSIASSLLILNRKADSCGRYRMKGMHWKDLLNDLVCPVCKAPIALTPAGNGLKCASCHRVYPIQDDIPILLVDRAKIEV